MKPPRENPRRSTCSKPSARIKATASRAGGAGYSAHWWTPTAFSALLREELESLLDELLVELEDSSVACVRVDHQLVVRQTSGHVEGVRRRQHPVVIAVREEHGLADERQVVRLLLAPAAAGLELREVRADGDRRVAVDRALLEPSQQRLALTLAVCGPGEEEELLRVLATQQAAEGVDLRDPHDLLHALATGRASAREDQLADQLWLVLGNHLGDHAAHGKSVKIDLLETQRADERDGVLGHRLDGVGRLASGGTDAAVVEGDDPVLCGDSVDHPRVPVVEDPRQVHEEDDRDTGLRAELAVGEIHPTSGDGAGWCVLVRRHHAASRFLFLIHVHGLLLWISAGVSLLPATNAAYSSARERSVLHCTKCYRAQRKGRPNFGEHPFPDVG